MRWQTGFVLMVLAALFCGCGKPAEPSAPPPKKAATPEPSEPPGARLSPARLDKALLEAAARGDAEKVSGYLAQGADPRADDRYGIPALFHAASGGHVEVIRALIEAGADPNGGLTTIHADAEFVHGGREAGTPLSYATRKGQTDAMNTLLELGASMDGTDPEGNTALMWAVEVGQVDAVKLLLERGANVNATNERDQTALMICAHYLGDRHRQIKQLLIDAGAR